VTAAVHDGVLAARLDWPLFRPRPVSSGSPHWAVAPKATPTEATCRCDAALRKRPNRRAGAAALMSAPPKINPPKKR
jgi:hypothetical protein